jgi:hypothetical protein
MARSSGDRPRDLRNSRASGTGRRRDRLDRGQGLGRESPWAGIGQPCILLFRFVTMEAVSLMRVVTADSVLALSHENP